MAYFMQEVPPREGTLMYKDSDGITHTCAPGSPLFSTVTMLATHYWSEKEQDWVMIFPDTE